MASEVQIDAMLQEKWLKVGILMRGVLGGAVLSAASAVHRKMGGCNDPRRFAAVDRRQVFRKPRQLEDKQHQKSLSEFLKSNHQSLVLQPGWGPSLMT